MRAKKRGKSKLVLGALIAVLLLVGVVGYLQRQGVAVLGPSGKIGQQESHLIIVSLLLCSIVVIPVFALTIGIVWRYRENSNKKTSYKPDWNGDRRLEVAWWGIPFMIIGILAVIAWNSSYSLDPYRALAASNKPVDIDVVALDWKWLFIYPDQRIASVNYLAAPANTPLNLHITSDTVMNSFWVPALGGQIYAMPGMNTQLHLIANQAGNYIGRSANISGQGFAKMTFTAHTTNQADFNRWIQTARISTQNLNQITYDQLAKPGHNNRVSYYSSVQPGLFDSIINKYMFPTGSTTGMGAH